MFDLPPGLRGPGALLPRGAVLTGALPQTPRYALAIAQAYPARAPLAPAGAFYGVICRRKASFPPPNNLYPPGPFPFPCPGMDASARADCLPLRFRPAAGRSHAQPARRDARISPQLAGGKPLLSGFEQRRCRYSPRTVPHVSAKAVAANYQ